MDLEKAELHGTATVMNATEPLPELMTAMAGHNFGPREWQHADFCPNNDDSDDEEDPEEIYGPAPRAPTPTPTLKISVRQSVEQEEAYIGPNAPLPPPRKAYLPRRSIGSLLPGQWLGEGVNAKRLRPRR